MEEATNPEELSKKAKEAPTEVKEIASAAVDRARSAVQAAWQEAKTNSTFLKPIPESTQREQSCSHLEWASSLVCLRAGELVLKCGIRIGDWSLCSG